MKRYSVFACVLVVLMAASAFAGGNVNLPDYQRALASAENTHFGQPLNNAKADTLVVYGGPGTQEGKFELLDGTPDWMGWTSVDNTHKIPKWHISDFNCANLDPGLGASNLACWCGETFPDDCGGSPEGYGNSYLERMDWTGTVANNEVDTDVSVTWDMNVDSEPGYDRLLLKHDDGTGFFEELGRWDGTQTVLDTTMVFTMTAGNYAGVGGDEVIVRFEFTADGAWSDEDCLNPTNGGCQVDNIEIAFDSVVQVTQDFQSGIGAFTFPIPPWVGNFAKLWTGLDDDDDCRSNLSTVVAFINNGSTVDAETLQPSLCTSHCYGPSGYIVSTDGGLAGPDYHTDNFIVSPKIAWPAGYDGALLEFDTYAHFDFTEAEFPGMYYIWSYRGTLDPLGNDNWSGWADRNFVYYGGPGWGRDFRPGSDLMEAGRLWAQVRMGVFELGWVWNEVGDDGVPAPYFDNVRVTSFSFTGPGISLREIDMAQDNFPTIDDLDLVNLENNSIRFDMATDIAITGHNYNDPGDSIVVTVSAVRTDSYLDAVPQMYFRMKANPVFDGVREIPSYAARVGTTPYIDGVIDADTVFTRVAVDAVPIPDKWAFDLPDGDGQVGDGGLRFFFPGDEIHYYIRATDMVDGVGQGVAMAPGDTAGYTDFSAATSYNSTYVVRGLPTIFDDGAKALTQPKVLFWNDFANRGAENEWYGSLDNLGYAYGVDYDVYYTNGPSSGVSDGLGGRAALEHIAGYETILYSSGNLATFTITNVEWVADKGDDIGLLENWLALGDKNMALFGDDILFDLESSPQGATFMSGQLGLSLDDRDLNPNIDFQAAPTVKGVPGNVVFDPGVGTPVTEWIAYGGCLGFNTFDAAIPTTATKLAYFADLDGNDTYDYSAASLNVDAVLDNHIIHVPYGFLFIYTPNKAPTPSATRTKMLEKILLYFGNTGTGAVSDVAPDRKFAVKSYPNPFNPTTKIAWSLPKKAATTVEIFNVRGNLVRTLVDNEVVEAEGSRVWNGKDNSGAQVASGVYFAKVRSGEYSKTLKLALVK